MSGCTNNFLHDPASFAEKVSSRSLAFFLWGFTPIFSHLCFSKRSFLTSLTQLSWESECFGNSFRAIVFQSVRVLHYQVFDSSLISWDGDNSPSSSVCPALYGGPKRCKKTMCKNEWRALISICSNDHQQIAGKIEMSVPRKNIRGIFSWRHGCRILGRRASWWSSISRISSFRILSAGWLPMLQLCYFVV